jgi:hypothetical protein
MLILPPGHAETVRLRARPSRRERWMLGGVVAVVAALAVALVISLGTAGRSSANGCIYATIPGAVGAQEVYQCGAVARSTCRSAATPGAFTADAARAVAAECRKAKLPVNP